MGNSYTILRQFLNEAVSGPKTDAMLYSLAAGDDVLQSNSEEAAKDMFLKTASGEFLDYLAANIAVVRPNDIGISDDSLRNIARIFTGYKNINSVLNDLLQVYFSIYQTNAYIETESTEDFLLVDGDDLIIELDDENTYTIYFDTQYFENIANASAIEVANYLNNIFLDQKINAIATIDLDIDTNLNTVRIVTKTQGSQGAIRIIGGTAQKALSFSSSIATSQDATTQFSITQPHNSIFRFTWTGGTDPDFDLIKKNDYVIVSGSEFNSLNEGTYALTNVVSGNVNHSYFEIYNTSGTAQSSVTLLHASDLIFFRPVDFTIIHRDQYAAIFETVPGEIDLTIPASTSIVMRTPTTGGSYISEVEYEFTLSSPVSFSLSETIIQAATRATGTIISISGTSLVLGNVQETLAIFSSSGSLYGSESNLTGTYSSSPTKTFIKDITGAYLFDLDSYFLTENSSTLSTTIIQGSNDIIISVVSTTNFPTTGYLVFDFGYDNEETIVPYINILNSKQIQLDSSYVFKKTHIAGTDVTVLDGKDKYQVSSEGTDLGVYLTDVANARQNFVDNFNQLKAAGIFLNEQVLYPNDYGLPNAGTIYSDIIRVYGPDSALDTAGLLKLV